MREPIQDSRPPPRFEIRRMRGEDLDPVMEIERAAFRHPWSVELLRRELTHDWSTILLAFAPGPGGGEGKLLGFVIFWVVHDEIHILNVAVDPADRRQGVGRALISACIERARQLGSALVTLEVRRSNHAAFSLYRGFGFHSVGVRPNYYVDEGEDAIVMILDL
jgi:ribosomal-protein-alanine N-acetyltransferase